MTREQINQILSEGGVDTSSSKLLVNALLNAFNDEKKSAVEEATKTAKEEVTAQFKDYVKPEDHKRVTDEIAALKDAGAKSERTNKYKAQGLKDKWVDFAEGKLKDSKDFDKDLEKFKKENGELFEASNPNPTPTKNTIKFGNVGSGQGSNETSPNSSMNSFIRGQK